MLGVAVEGGGGFFLCSPKDFLNKNMNLHGLKRTRTRSDNTNLNYLN
jgi:hypothetical protein